jgi:orotate phosphoribosyltransferase
MSLHPDKMQAYVKHVTTTLRRFPREVGLVFRGVSGMLVGIRAADKTKRPYAIVRKDDEKSHSISKVLGWLPEKYVIVDDFVSTGTTIKTIVAVVDAIIHDTQSHCVGIILYTGYNQSEFDVGGYKVRVFGTYGR